MGLSNKQIGYIVDEIFEKVSQPIINENNRLLETADYDRDHEYLKDYEQFQEYRREMGELDEKRRKLMVKWENKSIYNIEDIGKCYFGDYWMRNGIKTNCKEVVIKELKLQNITLRKYPDRTDIERQVILNENNDIPKLIQTLIEKFTSQ